MKTLSITVLLSILNVNYSFLPTGTLTIAMTAAIVLDFITGIIKASFKNEARTSQGYRKTVVKFIQYGGAVCVGTLLKYLMIMRGDKGLEALTPYMDYLNDGLLIFIIFIEVTSVLENMYAIDNKSPFAIYFIKPMLSLMTFAIKNNPINKPKEQKQDS